MLSDQPSPLLAVWERFISTGSCDTSDLRPEIAEAWLRCQRLGVDPLAGRHAVVLPAQELAELRERHRGLIDVARPFMGQLYQFVASSSFVVLLTDERGVILETAGDLGVIAQARDLNFDGGALWSEAAIGSNGVGTAAYLQRPFQVSGAEHYCRKHHPWTCSGAPIFREDGRLLAVLEMSGPVEATHEHTLGMVVAAAEAIRQQLRGQEQNRQLALVNSHLGNVLSKVSDGILVVDNHGVIRRINPVAERLLGAAAADIVGRSLAHYLDRPGLARELRSAGWNASEVEVRVGSGRERTSCLVSAKPILDDHGDAANGVIFLNPTERMTRLVNRFTGAHATFTFDDIIGRGEALAHALERAHHAAASDSHVLLTGESGTGKEMFAHAIHNHSARRTGPFIAINCGALPRELVGSELFGYEEGAFTGASKGGRPGKFELAAGGSLFLDEIGDMPMDQQASLLRVLQDKTITRIGGDAPRVVDVRVICATHHDLTVEIARGSFRQDLYYRLNVISITLPPLREHLEDLPMLFRVFYERTCRRLGREARPVDADVFSQMRRYAWPGNMREFQNMIEKTVNQATGDRIRVEDLPRELLAPAPRNPRAPLPEGAALSVREHRTRIKDAFAQEEQKQLLAVMASTRGNLSEAARTLGISRTSLYRRLAKAKQG